MPQLLLIQFNISLLVLAALPANTPHVYPDNYIERSVSVVIRDDTARIEYSLAMNDTTIQRLIQQWQSPDEKSEKINQPSNAETSSQESFDSGDAETKTDSPRSVQDGPKSDEDDFANDANLVAEFRKLVAEKVAADIRVKCNDQSVVIQEVNPDLPPRYHTTVTMQFEFKLPAEKLVDLSITDSNFSQYDGEARYALKVGGKLVLTKSNVAPILVRAKRIEFADLTESDRAQACQITAQIVRTP